MARSHARAIIGFLEKLRKQGILGYQDGIGKGGRARAGSPFSMKTEKDVACMYTVTSRVRAIHMASLPRLPSILGNMT